MLIEVRVKVSRIIDNKTRKRTETFIVDDCQLFVEAEHAVMNNLSWDQQQGLVEDYEVQSLKISPIREVCTQYAGESSFIATLKDVFIEDDGTEKSLKYKVLLWADSLSEAMARTNVFSRQGYNMSVEGLKEVNYEYLTQNNNESSEEASEETC